MLRYLSETTDEEKLHVRRGTIDSLESHMKMRFVAPGDWIRIKFDLQPLVRQACAGRGTPAFGLLSTHEGIG